MAQRRGARFAPGAELLEGRLLLALAVVEINNHSSYNLTFAFRWTPSSSWTTYTETPGQGRNFWTTYSDGLQPQVKYASNTSGSQVTMNLSQGYGRWGGSGTPPDSSATKYEFDNSSAGVTLYYAAPPTPTYAVVEILNSSTYNITFGMRWSPDASWKTYTEAPGEGEIFWIPYDEGLAPQAVYATDTAGHQLTVNLAQGYGQWTGTGTPPASSAKLYQFDNSTTGVTLYYEPAGQNPTPSPAADAQTSTNWAGYVVTASAGSVTAVRGSWVVPSVSGPSSGTYTSSTWVGIDGYGSGTVEQIGTEQGVLNGVPYYRAWWEMYSSGLKQPEQVIRGMTIMPGDSITAVVQYITSGEHAGQFYLAITDTTRNQSFSTYQTSSATQSPLAQRSTAEWVMEAPTIVGSGVAPMPNFSTVRFTNASAVIDGVSGAIGSAGQVTALNLVPQGGSALTVTSVLTGGGTGFSVSSTGGVRAGATSSGSLQTTMIQPGGENSLTIMVGGQGPIGPPSDPTQSSTSTSLTAPFGATSVGEQYLLVAAVQSDGGTPWGDVDFYEGDTLVGSASLVNGSASISLASSTVGLHQYWAMFQGNSDFAASMSPTASVQVNALTPTTPDDPSPSPTTTDVGAVFPTAESGAPFLLYATVQSDAGVPWGDVAFYEGNTQVGTATLSNGTATLVLTAAAGVHLYSAVFLGSSDFSGSNSPPAAAVRVDPAPVAVAPSKLTGITLVKKRGAITAIVIQANGQLDPASVRDLSRYTLATARRVGKKTVYDQKIRLASASYNATTGWIMLRPKGNKLAISGTARLTVSGVLDASGRLVDGDRNGSPGGKFAALITNQKARLTIATATPGGPRARALASAG